MEKFQKQRKVPRTKEKHQISNYKNQNKGIWVLFFGSWNLTFCDLEL